MNNHVRQCPNASPYEYAGYELMVHLQRFLIILCVHISDNKEKHLLPLFFRLMVIKERTITNSLTFQYRNPCNRHHHHHKAWQLVRNMKGDLTALPLEDIMLKPHNLPI